MSDNAAYLGAIIAFFAFVGFLCFNDDGSKMRTCINAGYEWKGGDCVKAPQ